MPVHAVDDTLDVVVVGPRREPEGREAVAQVLVEILTFFQGRIEESPEYLGLRNPVDVRELPPPPSAFWSLGSAPAKHPWPRLSS